MTPEHLPASPRRLALVAVTLLVLSAGCAALPGGSDTVESRLELTVHNQRSQPISVQVTVRGPDGAVAATESDRLDPNVGQAFDFTVTKPGLYELTVAGDDWRGQLTWNAQTCAHFDATVRVTPASVEVAGQCVDQR